MSGRLKSTFFQRGVLELAPELLGKILIRRFDDSRVEKFVISEVEAYSGEWRFGLPRQ
jgi:DNA-3-methyladenine glycosylase